MSTEALAEELNRFLDSTQAKRLCRPYFVSPDEATGELYLQLAPKIGQPFRNFRAWVRTNASCLLRNFLRRECKPLAQSIAKGE